MLQFKKKSLSVFFCLGFLLIITADHSSGSGDDIKQIWSKHKVPLTAKDIGMTNCMNEDLHKPYGEIEGVTSASVAVADSYEPDNTPADATAVFDGSTQSHTIHADGDVDWLAIILQVGESLIAETSNLAGSNPDTVLELYDNSCNLLAEDDDGGSAELASRIEYTAQYSGDHYIKVSSYGGSSPNCDDQGGGPAHCYYDVSIMIDTCDIPPQAQNPDPVDDAADVPISAILSWNGGGGLQSSPGPKVIFGQDDRLDEYQVTDQTIREVGDSTVAVVSRSDLSDNGDGTFSLPNETFAEYYLRTNGRPLCVDEPFRKQPNPASCSGFSVASDIIATAGHCITNAADCANSAFVFGFFMLDATTPVLTIDASQIYYCDEILGGQQGDADWAIIRLDREVFGHNPLNVRHHGKVQNDEDLLVIGYPVGLPRKYAGGATVRDNTASEYFQTNSDTYGGNSGSAVFNADTLTVEGILVRGNPDFIQDIGCDRSNVCPDTGCPTLEEVTRATEFSSLLPSSDVYFGTDAGQLSLICSDIAATSCDPGQLLRGTTYHWRVDTKNECSITKGLLWSFTTALSTSPCEGDFDNDGDMDGSDLALLAADFGRTDCGSGPPCEGNFDGDNDVDESDLAVFSANFGGTDCPNPHE